jgi:hypothetical protein
VPVLVQSRIEGDLVMARFRSLSLGFAATLLLAAPHALAADPPKNSDQTQPNVQVESPSVDPELDPTRNSTILSRSAAKRRGENPDDAAGAGAEVGETPRTSTRCWDGACARSDWTNGIKNNRGPNATVHRG